ncbi:Ca2+-transporting ATPase [Desulfonispora thiosulfatigenes DSM 11270]|uniref:P-type Ca(2+) transporter n=1 Tax=Desulfonispora thiosulfatigenes DSM 11270 TaxID=656914 RepID=A0A1W1UYS4_DESTI|nr:cation-translocating P-type ATPase [Desulfonispora thiosulfatigenes]SMB86160.1 Ca2+-transporting ATPase [Desulfonispora thiosulfatigenes DSM 11270]
MQHYFEGVEDVLKEQETSKEGIKASNAQERLTKFGKNKLEEAKKKNIVIRFLELMLDPMIIVLIAAAVVSGLFGEVADMIIIFLVVILNGVLGVVQEGKAEKAIEALQQMSSTHSRVRRDNEVVQIKSEDIVPGDIVLLEAGDAVPADMRIIESASLKVEESPLTGESVQVDKFSEPIEKEDNLPLGDRLNMLYMGTSVGYGRGEGVVVATGMETEMGKIAGIIARTEGGKTPLQNKLASLSKVLSFAVLGISIFIFAFSILRKGDFSSEYVFEMFMLAVSLAVAAIPEGLATVVTVVLSIGVTKMSKRNAIIRRLTAVETLGSTQIICSDKTGTLTQNKMTVVDSYGQEEILPIALALCNDTQVSEDGSVLGEPTESALVTYALKQEKNKNLLEKEMPRVEEAPFDSDRKMMSTIHKNSKGEFIQYTKGAPDEVLKQCTQILTKKGIEPLTDSKREEILGENTKMAEKALRVLAAATKNYNAKPENRPEELEKDMIFIGLVGMIDPIRPEVKIAIGECRDAGIRPIMITGDHKITAVAIAKELGILNDQGEAITGAELSRLSDEEFEKTVEKYAVYARVQPEHKVRIVNAWKKKGKITAMTGDGVNDAPALKSADIGIGMGITGTQVTKNVADMVLADDNFASIVSAVKEGRRIYNNIRKTVQFLLASNLSEVLALFIATLFAVRLFSPIHILWINLITDTFPAIALGMEEHQENSMKQPPRDPKESIFARGVGISILYQGLLIAVITLISFFIGNDQSHITGMTMAFLTLSMCEIFHSMNMRSLTGSIFTIKKQNKYLWGAMISSFVLTIAVIYTPGLNNIFKLVALPWYDFLVATALALAVIPIVEIIKVFKRRVMNPENM